MMQRCFLLVVSVLAVPLFHAAILVQAFQSTGIHATFATRSRCNSRPRHHQQQRQPSDHRLQHPQKDVIARKALVSEMDALWQTYPYTAAALVCGFKASAADIVAQVKEFNKGATTDDDDQELVKGTQLLTATTAASAVAATTESKEEEEDSFSFFLSHADWKRNAAFIAYGALYQGITQEFFYNHMYPIWFGTGTGLETVLIKVAFTLLVQTTVLTLPSLYASKALIEGFSIEQATQQYIYDIQYQGLLQKFYILWGPVLCLTFSVIPVHLRVTFIALVSFFWLIILSSISGSDRGGGDGGGDELQQATMES